MGLKDLRFRLEGARHSQDTCFEGARHSQDAKAEPSAYALGERGLFKARHIV